MGPVAPELYYPGNATFTQHTKLGPENYLPQQYIETNLNHNTLSGNIWAANQAKPILNVTTSKAWIVCRAVYFRNLIAPMVCPTY